MAVGSGTDENSRRLSFGCDREISNPNNFISCLILAFSNLVFSKLAITDIVINK